MTPDTNTSSIADHEPPISEGRSRRMYFIVGIITLVLLLGYGLFVLLTSGKEGTDDAQVTADVVPISARVAGQLTNVYVQDNQEVPKGALVAEIDPRDLQVKLTQAQSDLETARAQALAAEARVQVASATARGGLTQSQAAVQASHETVDASSDAIAESEAGLTRAQANAEKARLDFKRMEELGAKGDVPRMQVDAARAATLTADADVATARARLSSSRDAKQRAEAGVTQAQGALATSNAAPAQIAAAQADAQLAQARVKTAEAAVSAAELNLSYTKIYAPAAGIASRLGVHVGQLITVGQPIVQLVPHQTYIVANFKETQLRDMKPGQKVDIAVDIMKGHDFEGTVESLSGGTGSSFSLIPADNASGNFVKVVQRVPVRIRWNGPPASQVPVGSSCDVTVHTK
jgi:membrane fusion protein (multidrug efflux system)